MTGRGLLIARNRWKNVILGFPILAFFFLVYLGHRVALPV